jgi:quinol monooxygenase YgiN
MQMFHIEVRVKAESIDAFREATIENARNSVREPSVACFDFYQRADDPSRFLLIEAYRDPEGPARHRQTPHYLKWRDAVESMMAGPRDRAEYTPVFTDLK